MQQDPEHLELVQKAVSGDRESLSLLAEIAQGAEPRAYVQRVVLREDRAADITQEAMVAMLGSLGQLRDAKRFWPWVFTIASNKVRQSFRRADLHPVGLSEVQDTGLEPRSNRDGPAEGLSRRELVDITRDAMEDLDVRHRMVLSMRFYEDLPHSEIGGVLGCSEMVARITFLRAKRALLRALRRRGIAESSLIAALLAFGRHTAPASAAAQVSVSTTATAESLTRSVLSRKTGVAAAACIAALLLYHFHANPPVPTAAIPSVLARSNNTEPAAPPHPQTVAIRFKSLGVFLGSQDMLRAGEYDNYLVFPQGWNGPHLSAHLPTARPEDRKGKSRTAYVVSAHGPMILNDLDKRAILHNEIAPNCDEHTEVLPIDSADFCTFVAEHENPGTHALIDKQDFNFTRDPVTGFVRTCLQLYQDQRRTIQFEQVEKIPELDLLNYEPPAGYEITDKRDTMHRSEWAHFTIKGYIGRHAASGGGEIPFTYAASRSHPAWLRLNVGEHLICDDGQSAHVADKTGHAIATYPGGSFCGMSRPWEGFFTADTLRREAVTDRLPYVRHKLSHSDVAVSVGTRADAATSSAPSTRLVGEFVFDKFTDTVKSIRITTSDASAIVAQMTLTYLDDANEAGPTEVSPPNSHVGNVAPSPGIFWPAEVLQVIEDVKVSLVKQ